MHKDLESYIEKAMELEIATSRLYALFAKRCPEDASFWNQLQLEEMNHAALLRAGKKFAGYDKFPETLMPEQITELDESIRMIAQFEDDFNRELSREKAFAIAQDLENSAGELHYQNFMNSQEGDALGDLFRKLNRADSNHARRIMNYYDSIKGEL